MGRALGPLPVPPPAPLLVGVALLAWLLLIAAPARAALRRSPTLAPANTVIDGPDPDIVGLSGMAIARDGTGGVVYLKKIQGVAHVFVSRLLLGRYQAPEQADAGLGGPSSQPVIAAAGQGLLLIAFVNGGALYVVQAPNGLAPLSTPSQLFAGAANPALSMSQFGKAYLAFTAQVAGNSDVRSGYYYQGQWALEPTPLEITPGDKAGSGTGRPAVAAAGDGVGIVAWGEAGHVYTRRVWGTQPSISSEQADVPSLGGLAEASADEPAVSAGGDSSYAAVVFRELLIDGSSQQSRVLVNRLRGSQYDGISAADGAVTPGPEGADQPQLAVTEYGAGFVTSETDQSHQLFATSLGNNESAAAPQRVDSQVNAAAPDAVPAAAGLYSTLIAWQQSPGLSGPPDIRVRYAPDGSDLGTEQVISSPALGPAEADSGLADGGDGAGDAAIAWVQGTGAATEIVAAQLYQSPGGFAPASTFRYANSTSPILAWSAASELWGPLSYAVSFDGAQIATTSTTLIRTPAPVSQGRHVWQITALNQAGIGTAARSATVFVDSVAPQVSFTLTGVRRVHSTVHVSVSYTDSPAPVTKPQASGINTVQVKWGDGAKYFIHHGKFHVYSRARTYLITVIVKDRAGNRTVVTRSIRIQPKQHRKAKKK